MNLNVSVPINSLSFGYCGYNILKELYNRGVSPNLFLIGGVDLSSFDHCPEDFKFYLQSCANKALKNYSRDYPELKLWHIQSSEVSHSKKQSLFTFHETSKITEFEANILKNQENVFVSSNHTKGVMEAAGLNNVVYCPLGFDSENVRKLNTPHPYNNSCVVWYLGGKMESRKNTLQTLRLWTRKYGNNPQHRLHLHVFNSFLHQDPAQCAELNKQEIAQALEGKNYWNVNIINSHLKTLTEMNSLWNSIDIALELSGNEGFSLPTYNTTALGKHLVALHSNGVADWATEENAVLIKPNGIKDSADSRFFHKGQPFNQGDFFTYSDEDAAAAIERVLARFKANPVNEAGLKLQEKTWKQSLDIILDTINKQN